MPNTSSKAFSFMFLAVLFAMEHISISPARATDSSSPTRATDSSNSARADQPDTSASADNHGSSVPAKDPGSSMPAVDPAALQTEEPHVDAQDPSPKKMLNGSVQKSGSGDSTDQALPGSQQGSTQDQAIKAGADENAQTGNLEGAAQAVPRKFGPFHIWTSDDYRSMQYGIGGLEELTGLFIKTPVVVRVFKGCPAEQAGIKRGDLMVAADGHRFHRFMSQKEFWMAISGRAGTPVDVTVSRHGEELNFHLIRMNIEDIPDNGLRRMYERMLRSLGTAP